MRAHRRLVFLWPAVVFLVALSWGVDAGKLKQTSRANGASDLVASPSASQHRHVGTANVNKTTSVSQVAALLASKPRSTSNTGAEKKSNNKQLASASSKVEPVRVDSKTGRKIARMQTKRQIFDGNSFLQTGPLSQPPNATTGSRRNEDPWFLDQTPYPLQPYRFVYNVKGRNGQTEQYRQEVGDGKFLTGSYGYVLPDGIYRHVDYVADDRGFRAFIRTSEPGTANQNPADVVINANPLVVAPGVTYATGLDATLNNPTFPSSFQSSSSLPQTPSFSSQSSFANNNLNSSPLDYSRELTSGGQLPRRAPGSIVGTPARNFSSFSYGPTPSPLSTLDFPVTPDSLNPLRRVELLPSYGPSGARYDVNSQSSSASNSQPRDGSSGNWQAQAQADLPNEQFGDRIRSSQIEQQQPTGTNRPQASSSGTSGDGGDKTTSTSRFSQSLGPQWSPASSFGPLQPSRFSEPTRRPSLSVFTSSSRFGSNVLSYDRPFSVARDTSGQNSKLDYDNKHLLHPDSPYLSLERARNIAHLEQLNAVSRGAFANIRAPLFATHLGTLTPTNPVVGSPVGVTSSFSTLGQLHHQQPISTSGGSSGGGHSEHHRHEEHHSSKHIVDDVNKITLSKEHRSGSSSGSGREFNFNTQPGDKDSRPPPPQPHFQHDHNRDTTARHPPGDGVKGHSARLQAPYAGFLQQQQHQHQDESGGQLSMQHLVDRSSAGQVKGGSLSGSLPTQQFENVELEPARLRQSPPPPVQPPTSPQPPTPPEEPRAPSEPSSPATSTTSSSPISPTADNLERQRFGTKTSVNEDNEQETSSTKSAPLNNAVKGATGNQQHHQVRSVRTSPEEFRTNMLMNDLRTMQQAIGLPQPPRLQRSSPFDDQRASFPASGFNLADQIVSSRMKRVEALLTTTTTEARRSSTGGEHPQAILSAGQASVQQSVAVSALARETDPTGSQQAKRSKKQEQHRQDSRNLSTGPVVRSLEPQQPSSLLAENQINTGDAFEAQRLVTQRARLQAEKVSELEKFQQRLRAQQLLSEQVKQQQQQQASGIGRQTNAPSAGIANQSTPQTSNYTSSSRQRGQPEAHSLVELNSQVRYDDQPEAKPHLQTNGLNQRDFSRARRQNDASETNEASAPANSSHKTNGIHSTALQATIQASNNTSELAKQIKSWPSISSLQSTSFAADNNKSTQRDEPASGDHSPNSIDSSPGLDKSNRLSSKPHRQEPVGVLEAPNQEQSSNHTGGHQSREKPKQQQATRTPANTINLDFINSVTALSVDHLNPFAISSVNPAIQRSEASNSARLSPHKLAAPTLTGNEQQTLPAVVGGGAFATASARYSTSPELLAILNRHDRFIEAQSEPRSGPASAEEDPTGGFLLPSNHRAAAAPYMLPDQHQSPGSSGAPSPLASSSPASHLAAKFLVGPTTVMSEAANSQHKSFALPAEQSKQQDLTGNKTTTSNLIKENNNTTRRQQEQSNKNNNSSQAAWSIPSTRSTSTATRDAFDVRHRAIQVDNHRFFEVVSNLRQPHESSATFQAFKG